jgi:alpha-2-macroglobulin
MNARITETLQMLRRHRLITAGSAALLLAVAGGGLAYMLTRDGDGARPAIPEPPGFSVSAEGDAVPRLAPIRVRFESPPAEREASKLLAIEPAPEGDYLWAGDRTVLFQPKYPGLLRGNQYTVKVPARPEAGLQQDFSRTFTTEGLLTVDAVIPAPGDSEVPAKGQVLVQFSRSVAPLTLLSAQSNTPVIEFMPALPGKGEWLNTSLYRFIPDAIPGNTKFRARIPAGLTSAADGVLKADYTWEFTTFSPAVDYMTPDEGSIFASLRQPVTIGFNQPMERASVEAAFKLMDSAGAAIPGTWAWESPQTATFTPSRQLAQAAKYGATLARGARGLSGGETLAARSVSFTTVGPATIDSTEPANGQTDGGRFGIYIRFSNPMDVDTLDGKVSISGIPAEEIGQNFYADEMYLSIGVRLKPSTNYTATFAAGATDRYGQPLAPYTWSFRTGALGSSLIFAVPGQVATYSASAEPVLFFHSTNLAAATFSLHPLTKAERDYVQGVNHLYSDVSPDRVFRPSLPALRTWTQPLGTAPDEVILGSTSLSGGGRLPPGDYFVRNAVGTQVSALAFTVVDTAIILKAGMDELLAWAVDMESGRPVPGLVLSGTGVSGPSEVTTDANGLASFRLSSELTPNYYDEKLGLTVRAESGGRKGVATMWWRQGVDIYQLGLPIEGGAKRYVSHLYTERPIYRPGEEVFFKGVIRIDDDAIYTVPEAKPPISIVVMSSQGKELLKEPVQLNSVGSFARSLKLPEGADTGDYSIGLEWRVGQDVNFVGGTSFQVAEFRRPEFQVEVKTAQPSYTNGDTIAGSAVASFFFGGPLQGASLEWSVMSNPTSVSSKEFPFYSFSEFEYVRWWDVTTQNIVRDPVRARGTAVTNADGIAAFSVPATIRGDEGPQQFTLSATVTDQTGQAVAGSTTVTVHQASVYAGIRPADYIATAGEAARVDLVTVDTEGKPLPNRAVSVKVYDRKWVTTKESTPEGARRYRSQPLDTLLETLTTTTDGKATGFVTVTAKSGGTLRLVAEATDDRGRTSKAATYLWVSSGEFASWYISNDDTIKLVADKDAYEVGETAQVLVPAPFAGATGLITTERGKIHSRNVQAFPTNSTQISVPIVERSVPDVYVSVVLYRPPTVEDPIPRYKVGYARLPVSTKTRLLDVKIQPDRQQAKPGDKVKYDIRVTDSNGKGVKSEVSVAVVDKAVLSLAEERSPTGLAAFWYARGLSVRTASTLAVNINRTNDVISEPRQGGKGGGGVEDDRIRQEFKNTAYWNAQIETKEDGTATVEVTMPDNLTTWRMQVRAISGDTRVGEGTNELLSTQPLLLRPALPRFLRVGDKAVLRLLVRNATDKTTEVDVALKAEGVAISGETDRKATVEPGKSVVLEWPAAVAAEGQAKLTFTAKSNTGLGDGVIQELPVALDVTPETTATGGVVKGVSLLEALYLPEYAILEGGSLEVGVQPSLTGLLDGELGQFDLPFQYPGDPGTGAYAARLIATVAIARAEASANGSAPDRKNRIQGDLAALVSRQRQDGGWAWCSNYVYCESDPWISAWALIAIGEAKKAGHSFDSSSLSRAVSYITAETNRPADVKYPADPSRRAFYHYALATAGDAGARLPVARALFEQYRAQLTNWGRAYLLLTMAEAGQTKADAQVGALLNDLASSVMPSANGNFWEDEETGGYGYVATRTTSLVLQAIVAVDPSHPLIEETTRWITVARGTRSWEESFNRAQGIVALSNFAASTGELGGNFSFAVKADGKDLLSGRLKGTASAPVRKKFDLEDFKKGAVTLLDFTRDGGAGRMYYTLNLRYLTPAQDVEALNRGIAVSHEYSLLSAPGVPVSKAKLGEVVRIKVTVMSVGQRNYVVVDDLLPAGLEAIDPSLKTSDPALIAKLNAEKESANRRGPSDYYAPWFHWYWSPFQQVDIRDDRVSLRALVMPKGVHEFIYYARATSVGDYFIAPAHAEESLFPEVFGRSDSGRFTVEP